MRNNLWALFLFFCAASAAAADTVLYALGDTGDCQPATARVAKALRAQPDMPNAFLLELGDLAYPTATRQRLLECHEPFFSQFKNRLAVPGNHDWRDEGAAGFFSIFPEPVPRSVDLNGSWRLLLLDSNLRADAWQAQLQWLKNARTAAAGKCVIAAWHHPRWSSGAHGDNAFTAPLWAGVSGLASITLHGHDHHFEALPPLNIAGEAAAEGTASFVAGNGGARLYPVSDIKQGSRVLSNTWGFMRLQLSETAYSWQAFDFDGQVREQGSGRCLLLGSR